MAASGKIRLDQCLVERGLVQSRSRARALIMAGRVLVASVTVDKPGTMISVDAPVDIRGEDIPFVSRGGLKLAAALDAWPIEVAGLICLDVGASTGGFTDCLLQRGAEKVYAVDVGYGQLAWKIRQDARVIPMERTNIRNMPDTAIPEKVDLVTIDTSFISLKIVVPAATRFLKNGGALVALIKPQFEVGKGKVGKGGVVRDPTLHQEVVDSLRGFFSRSGMIWQGVISSPVIGPKGNREFLSWMLKPV